MLKAVLAPSFDNLTLEAKFDNEDEYKIVESMSDSLQVLTLDEVVDSYSPTKGQKGLDSIIDPANLKIDSISPPTLLQAPPVIPPLFPSVRTNVFLLLSPDAP